MVARDDRLHAQLHQLPLRLRQPVALVSHILSVLGDHAVLLQVARALLVPIRTADAELCPEVRLKDLVAIEAEDELLIDSNGNIVHEALVCH